jgi:hypothetical protein
MMPTEAQVDRTRRFIRRWLDRHWRLH